MPYQSKAQVRFMHARHPEVAKRWDAKYGVSKDLPEKKGGKVRAKKKWKKKGKLKAKKK